MKVREKIKPIFVINKDKTRYYVSIPELKRFDFFDKTVKFHDINNGITSINYIDKTYILTNDYSNRIIKIGCLVDLKFYITQNILF